MPCRSAKAVFAAVLFATQAAQAEPRGVIEWLNQAPPAPSAEDESAPFEGLGPDGEEIHADGDSADPASVMTPLTPQEIDSTPIAGVIADSTGLLTEEEGGLPSDLWNGVTAERAAEILRGVRPGALRSANQLARLALLSAASAPAATTEDGEIITLRAQALLELGLPQDALALLRASGLRTPVAMALQLDASALTGEDAEVCALALRSGSLDGLSARRVYCLARTGGTEEAALALSTGRDLGAIRQADGELLEALIEPSWAEYARPPERIEDLTPLRLAALDQIGAARPANFGRLAPLSMRWADMVEDAPPRDRLSAAESLEDAGALPTEKLRELYEAYTPAESGGVWGRVEAWLAARDARGPEARIAAASRAYDRAASDKRAGPMARLLAPLLERARPMTEDGSQDVRRALALAGNFDDAIYWFAKPPTIGQLTAVKIAQPQVTPDLGKAQVAALRAKDALGDLAAGQQLAALTAFGYIERESRFTYTPELARVIQALESEQPAEALFAALAYLEPGPVTRPEPFHAALAALLALGREDEARDIALETLSPAL